MQAFMTGKIRVEGDMAMLMQAMQATAPNGGSAHDLAERLQVDHRVARSITG